MDSLASGGGGGNENDDDDRNQQRSNNTGGLLDDSSSQSQSQSQPRSNNTNAPPPPPPQEQHPCPRCGSTNTKFCYYNNYSLSQPRYLCKGCRRYWTHGGSLRNVPVGGGSRKQKRPRLSSPPQSAAQGSPAHQLRDHDTEPTTTTTTTTLAIREASNPQQLPTSSTSVVLPSSSQYNSYQMINILHRPQLPDTAGGFFSSLMAIQGMGGSRQPSFHTSPAAANQNYYHTLITSPDNASSNPASAAGLFDFSPVGTRVHDPPQWRPNFSIGGTIPQPDHPPSAGGVVSLDARFWSVGTSTAVAAGVVESDKTTIKEDDVGCTGGGTARVPRH